MEPRGDSQTSEADVASCIYISGTQPCAVMQRHEGWDKVRRTVHTKCIHPDNLQGKLQSEGSYTSRLQK